MKEKELADAMMSAVDEFDTDIEPRDARAEEIEDTVKRLAQEALDHYEENLEPRYVDATDYYYTRPVEGLREEKGRSKVMSSDLRDTVRQQLPSLLDIVFGIDKVVEFRPRGAEDVELAQEQTDAINFAVREENEAFRIFHSLLKDFMLRIAVVKWWWEETYSVKEVKYTGLSLDEAADLMADDEVEVVDGSIEAHQGEPTTDEATGEQVDGEVTIDFRVRVTKKGGCERFEAIPPEEFIYSPHARTLNDAAIVGHVREMPAGDVIAMGIDEDVVEKAKGKRRARSSSQLEQARQAVSYGLMREDQDVDESMEPVLYSELYMRCDGDGDKIPELRVFKCVGLNFEVTNYTEEGEKRIPGEIVDGIPFAMTVYDPEAHTVEGQNHYDFVAPIQRINSQIDREILNSLGRAVEPTTVYNEQANPKDVLNPDIKGVMRVRGDVNTAVRELEHAFVGPAAMQVREFFQQKLERSVGRNDATGVDSDSLQSSTKSAVNAALTSSQLLTKLAARVFAENIMAPLFKGMLKLSVQHRDREKMIRLRNKWVPVDPRTWDTTMDVRVNVGLGYQLPEERISTLKEAYTEGKALMQEGCPWINWSHLRTMFGKIIELSGDVDSGQFADPFGAEQMQAVQQAQANQPPPPDPQMALVQVEQMKAQMQAEAKQAELQIAREKMILEDDRERARLAQDAALKEYELELKNMADINDAQLQAKIQHRRNEMETDLKREMATMQAQPRTVTVKRAEA